MDDGRQVLKIFVHSLCNMSSLFTLVSITVDKLNPGYISRGTFSYRHVKHWYELFLLVNHLLRYSFKHRRVGSAIKNIIYHIFNPIGLPDTATIQQTEHTTGEKVLRYWGTRTLKGTLKIRVVLMVVLVAGVMLGGGWDGADGGGWWWCLRWCRCLWRWGCVHGNSDCDGVDGGGAYDGCWW